MGDLILLGSNGCLNVIVDECHALGVDRMCVGIGCEGLSGEEETCEGSCIEKRA